jgi:hypothetical protein
MGRPAPRVDASSCLPPAQGRTCVHCTGPPRLISRQGSHDSVGLRMTPKCFINA